MKMQLAN